MRVGNQDAPIPRRRGGGTMRIRVSDAIRQAGEPFPFEISETLEPQAYGERIVSFCEPMRVTGAYVFDGKAFTVRGRAQTAIASQCARCTKPFVEQISFSFSERFVKDADEMSEDETYSYAGDELELDKAVLDNLFLELPIASVCREDCKGLCPVCGADLNVTTCQCKGNKASWQSVLRDALSDEE
jgi:uncharacterized protein